MTEVKGMVMVTIDWYAGDVDLAGDGSRWDVMLVIAQGDMSLSYYVASQTATVGARWR